MLLNGLFFFFNDTATTEIYTLSLHDALPISLVGFDAAERWLGGERDATAIYVRAAPDAIAGVRSLLGATADRKSTRLNSSHANISYAVFCLKKKTIIVQNLIYRSNLDFEHVQ